MFPPYLVKRFRQQVRFGDKQNSQTVKPQIQTLHELNTLKYENTTKYAQNVHREPSHKQRDGDATD